MDLIQHYTIFSATFFYLLLYLIILSFTFIKKKPLIPTWIFFIPPLLINPLLLFNSGYYIIREQLIILLCSSFWCFYRLFTCLLKKEKLKRDYVFQRKTIRIDIFLLILSMMPIIFYLGARPALHNDMATFSGLTLSILGIAMIFSKGKKENKGDKPFLFYRHSLSTGTSVLWWGMFIIITPHLLGIEWIIMAGPILVTGLTVYPWVFGYFQKKLSLVESKGIFYSGPKGDYSNQSYS